MEEKKINQIREEWKETQEENMFAFIETYKEDTRAGVQKLVGQAEKRLRELAAERERIEGLKRYEREYAACGVICGIDEAGRGPLAGPVVAGAVILPEECDILYINDSKKLSAAKRAAL